MHALDILKHEYYQQKVVDFQLSSQNMFHSNEFPRRESARLKIKSMRPPNEKHDAAGFLQMHEPKIDKRNSWLQMGNRTPCADRQFSSVGYIEVVQRGVLGFLAKILHLEQIF